MTFYDRYAQCCQSQGIKPSAQATADRLGCSKANITALSKNGNSPKGDIVSGAARMLNVSADYLLGLIDEPHELEVDMESSMSRNEKEVVSMLRELNAEGQEAAIAMLGGLMSQDIYKKYPASELGQAKNA